MSASFAFYIHHHGSGHLMRALSIASQLSHAKVTFLGSDLARYAAMIPDWIACVHLPEDVAGLQDRFASEMQISFLHYSPFNVEKVARRAAVITTELHALFPVVLVVDVSVEVTLLATLCGIPTAVMRQNGRRDDKAHLSAYECAQLLIAPCSETLMNVSGHEWVNAKTFFSGGFSKYSGAAKSIQRADDKAVGVMVGAGGTSLNGELVDALAGQCKDRTIHVIGEVSRPQAVLASNVIFHGQLNDPASILSQCGVVIGNAGHNTVMEMADLSKKFVCIPEPRPFQEQHCKAALLEESGMAVLVETADLAQADWAAIIRKAEDLPGDCWQGVIKETALRDLASRLHQLWAHHFSLPRS